MLRSLSIRDFVIVDRLELEFAPGFTALTGETGAGKSILVDAVTLVLGARADAIVVREGAARAEISAEFDVHENAQAREWLADQALSDEGVCLLRRVIDPAGRGRAYINGTPVTVAQLRAAGEFLADIHGQHEHQSLLRSATQRELLDGYGGLEAFASRTSEHFRVWRDRREQRIQFETGAAAIAAEREQLEWQVRELENLGFTWEKWQELVSEHRRLAHAAKLIEGAQYAFESLSESERSVLTQLNAVIVRLESLRDYDASLGEVLESLEPAAIQTKEAIYALRHYQQRLEVDPQRLRDSERRIEAVHSACRKYRTTPEELAEVLERAKARLSELVDAGDPDKLKELEDEARRAYLAEAGKLSAARQTVAAKLSEQVTGAMQSLAMAGAKFVVSLTSLSEPSAAGLEAVEFRVAAHESMTALSLAKVASGGELSRISLAIQTVTSRVSHVPTLVFDEVDAGIGGRVAEIVGKMLKDLGRTHQVMCITHLPQVAACADHQWQVAKTSTRSKVSSRVVALDPEQRVDEIARMLGGVRITDTTRRHAAEMLGLK